MQLILSPVLSIDALGTLESLIINHQKLFLSCYGEQAFTPKLHMLIHMVDQIKEYGPGHHHWTMRYEGKNALPKSKKLFNFKNIPFSDEAPWIKYYVTIKADLIVSFRFMKCLTTKLGCILRVTPTAKSKSEVDEFLGGVKKWDSQLESTTEKSKEILKAISFLLDKLSDTTTEERVWTLQFIREQLKLLPMNKSLMCKFKKVAHIVPVRGANANFLHELLKDVICGLEKIGYKVEGSASFIEIVVKWWKIVNVRTLCKGTRLNDQFLESVFSTDDPKIVFLYNFLDWLDEWKEKTKDYDSGKLAKEIHGALHQTTYGLIDLARYCLDELKLAYVLLRKIKTDGLEHRFGKYRQLSGAQYHVSIRQAYECANKLRLQHPLPLVGRKPRGCVDEDQQWDGLEEGEMSRPNCNVVVS
ncbi:hypothetical protein HPB49_003439 [Dermacentor silvarum]|uniref:Uncharacterized protein n=1 Tax=Dermacentor silvarum TaxID=543639 RepID=A0ACB8CPN1_DERSI|nr:hypothetical protein HPB49_003439 [Dermacentor silvarum]